MATIDEFKAEYARQHPQRREKKLWDDETLVIASSLDKLAKELAALHRDNYELRRSMFGMKHKNCDE